MSARPATTRCATRTSSRTPRRWSARSARSPTSVRAGDARVRGAVDVSAKPHQRLLQPPTRGVRNWRMQMAEEADARVRADRGRAPRGPRLPTRRPPPGRPGPRAAAALGWYRARMGAWNAAAYATQRSPLWQRGTLRSSSRLPARAAERDRPPVRREVVRPLGQDAGRVAPHREAPDDLAVRDAAPYVRFSSTEKKT